jgi:hypothetical protein
MWIAGGHYYVDTGIALTDQTSEVAPSSGHESPYLVLNRNLKIYGGFAGTETSLDQRDPEANPTYLDGNVYYKDRHDFPVPDNIFGYDNRFSKRIMVAYNSTLTLDGLIFQYVFGGDSSANGTGHISEPEQGNGAFVRTHQSALTINNCLFRYAAVGFQGQMVHETSSTEPLRITNSRFTESGNTYSFFHITNEGGAGSVIFENNIFDNLQTYSSYSNIFFNTSHWPGASSVTEIKNSLFYNNGRLQIKVSNYLDESSSVNMVIENVLVFNNDFSEDPFLDVLSPLTFGTINLSIINSSFINNIGSNPVIDTAGKTGPNKLNLTMQNNVFYGNKISEEDSTPIESLRTGTNQEFQSTTISYNATDESGSTLLTNNDYKTGSVDLSSTSLTDLFVGQTDEDGNIDADGADDKWFTSDDGFVPKGNGVLHNAGNNTAVANIALDLKNTNRLQEDTVDIGAYELGDIRLLGQEDGLSILPTLLIYPNPVQKGSALYVDLSGLRTQQLIIRDVSGKHVKTFTLDGDQQKVDVGALSSGPYLVISVNDRNDYKAFKLIVE